MVNYDIKEGLGQVRPQLLLCLGLCCFSDSLAGVDICQEPTHYSHLSVAYYKHAESSIERNLGETRQENYNVDLLFTSGNKWVFGAGHRYTILNVSQLELQTNGHLHTFFLPVHRQAQTDHGSFRLSIAPALSASSNVMQSPGEYTGDALQLLAALVWGRELSERMSLR